MINHPNLEDQKAGDGSTEWDARDYSEKPKKRGFMKFLRKLGKGEGIAGKIVFGVLDILPVPNVHEIVKSVLKDPDVSFKDGAKMFMGKIDWTRTIIGIAIVVAVSMGWVSPEDITKIISAIAGL